MVIYMKYDNLIKTVKALFKDEPNTLALLSNASAFLMENIKDINWVGFYLKTKDGLSVGPFQGKVACSLIKPKMGVVGSSYSEGLIKVIPNVSLEENHIYCDPSSKSEVVIPIFNQSRVWGVLDVDSPIINRFDQNLVGFLHQFTLTLTNFIDFNNPLL